jgi:hypothetical protein
MNRATRTRAAALAAVALLVAGTATTAAAEKPRADSLHSRVSIQLTDRSSGKASGNRAAEPTFRFLFGPAVTIAAGASVQLDLQCPAGTLAISAGLGPGDGTPHEDLTISLSFPSQEEGKFYWQTVVRNRSSTDVAVTPSAVCVDRSLTDA